MTVNRVRFIDTLRGFSLFGILMANLLIFQFGIYGKDKLDHLSTIDNGALYFVKVFIEGSFMPIFTMLFGFSLIKLIQSIRNKKGKSRWSILRRATGLIALGLLHSIFLWEGDILLFYGFMTLFLVPFINRKPKTLFIWGSLLFLVATALTYASDDISTKEQKEMEIYVNKANTIYANGSYHDIYDFRLNVMPPGSDDPLLFYSLIIFGPLFSAPLFLLGMGLAKNHAFENMQNKRKWYVLGSLLVPIGITCKSISFIASNFSTMLLIGGSQLLAVGYIFLAALLFQTRPIQHLCPAFESVGKLSLTNYLLQTIICTTVFYGYGLGLFSKIGVFGGIIFGLVVYSLQCVLSIAYFKKFKRGPFEAALRIWTNWSWNGRINKKGSISHE
ncbi:DUF418 domain-containing protein [Lysinibacillus sp. NPDC093712]|uniref:DUF418 domain-containing protein n=1 Tax=Lysinibacillus sp. NPDC093712 TaxID=3390579 RepID=UPI003D0142C7